MTPIQVKHEIEKAEDSAKRNGFDLKIGNDIDLIALNNPYVKGVNVKTFSSFRDVVIYFQGYEQMKFEQRELNRLHKK